MEQQHTHFVGCGTLEMLLSTHDRQVPLYLTLIHERQATAHPGVISRCTYVVVSDIQQGVARYWRYRVGCVIAVGDQPLDPVRAAELLKEGQRTEAKLRAAIRAQFDLATQAAIVSFPKELALVEGATGLLNAQASHIDAA